MRNEGGRRGQFRRVPDAGRAAAAGIAPCSMTQCGKEATPPDLRRERSAGHPSLIGSRAQSPHLSRFASPWRNAAAGAPLSGAEWVADTDLGALVMANACGLAGAIREQAHAVLGGDRPDWSEDDGSITSGCSVVGGCRPSSAAMHARRIGIDQA
jgi:hypothetical protein